MAGIGFTPRRSMIAEDIRDLQCRAQQARRYSTSASLTPSLRPRNSKNSKANS